MYPNPYETSFSIKGIDGKLDVTIYNCLGQLVYKNKSDSGIIQADLLPGIYFLNVKAHDTNRTFTTKLIKN